MKKYLNKILIAACLTGCSLPFPAAASGIVTEGSLTVKADSLTYEKEKDTYRAFGNVHLEWDGAKLFADSALLRSGENLAEADGKVILEKDGDILHADHLSLNFETKKGVVTHGDLFMKKGNFHLRGTKMEKTGEDDYRVEDGYFTVCDGDSPSWKFKAREIKVTLGDYATGKNVLFYIKDVPVLYLPYMAFPVKRERQSGFLIPKFGTSTKKGFNLNVPYYWAISPSQELTATLDIQSKRGAGTEVDYRYIRKGGSEGSFRGYLIYDTNRDRLRGDLSQKHEEYISPTLTFKSDINYASDRDFYRDYEEVSGEYNRKSLDSNVFLTKHWQHYSLTPELRFTQDLESLSNTATLQKLPLITFNGIKQRIGHTPLFISFDSTFTNFYREEGFQGQRIDLHPSLRMYASPFAALEGTAWAGFRQRFYNMYGGDTGNGYNNSALFDAGASASSTLSRVYDTGWTNLPKLQHTMIPEVTYTYVQDRDQGSLPFFDYNDRIVAQSTLGYSLTNYLTGKFAEGDTPAVYRQLAYLRLSQGYDFSGTRRDLLTWYDELHPFQDIRVEAAINPVKRISFNTDSRYNPYHTNFSTANVSVKYDDETGNNVSAGYRFSRTQVDYFEGKVNLGLFKPFFLHFNGRYSIDGGDFLESYYAVEYKQQCWSVTLSYGERQGDKEFFVNFALAGIGPLGKLRAY